MCAVFGWGRDATIPLVARGRVGFLATTTPGAFIIVMEMVSGQALALSLRACALLCNGIARLMTPPLVLGLGASTASS